MQLLLVSVSNHMVHVITWNLSDSKLNGIQVILNEIRQLRLRPGVILKRLVSIATGEMIPLVPLSHF